VRAKQVANCIPQEEDGLRSGCGDGWNRSEAVIQVYKGVEMFRYGWRCSADVDCDVTCLMGSKEGVEEPM